MLRQVIATRPYLYHSGYEIIELECGHVVLKLKGFTKGLRCHCSQC